LLSVIFYRTKLDMQRRQIDFLFTHYSSDPVLFQNGLAIFYSVVAVPHLASPFTLKAAEFSTSALQPSQHCCNF
jgi:hypothetical protein